MGHAAGLVRSRSMAQILATTALHAGWLDLNMLTIALDEGEMVERELVDPPSGAAVLAYDPERRVAMLISELRPPVLISGEEPLLEVVAGAIDDGGAPIDCARREAMEEAGLRLGVLVPVGQVWPSPAFSTERISLFLAAYARHDRVAAGGGLDEEQEHIRTREISLATLGDLARGGRIPDAKTLILVQALMLSQPELFIQAG